MARAVSVDWYEDDELCGAKEAGYSLHLTVEAARAYIRQSGTPHFGHGLAVVLNVPSWVSIPSRIHAKLRPGWLGVFKSSPKECPHPPVDSGRA